jgi:regulator of protease activity HflC (stomatin/prohibitin superfamily)
VNSNVIGGAIADAVSKINANQDETKHNWISDLIAPIAFYLQIRLEGGDEDLAVQITQEHKTFQKCIDFVAKQCEKHLGGKVNGQISDNDVYLMAVDYFRADDAELERQKAIEDAIEEEKRKEREIENKRLSEERIAKASADKAQREADKKAEAAQKAFAKKQAEGQLGLFDLQEDCA